MPLIIITLPGAAGAWIPGGLQSIRSIHRVLSIYPIKTTTSPIEQATVLSASLNASIRVDPTFPVEAPVSLDALLAN